MRRRRAGGRPKLRSAASRCRAKSRWRNKIRCKRARERLRRRQRKPIGKPLAWPVPDREEKNGSTNAATSMLHDSLEAGALEALPGGVGGFLVGVGPNVHAIIFVALRSNNEGRKFFLLQVRREVQGIGFAAQRGDLQRIGASGDGGHDGRLSALASCGSGNVARSGCGCGPRRL